MIKKDVAGGESGFVEEARLTADQLGNFSLRLRAKRSASWLAEVLPSATCDGATSSMELVGVRKRVRISVSDGVVQAGERVTIRARAIPCAGHRGDQLVLLMDFGSVFASIAEKASDNQCRAQFNRKMSKSTRFKVRSPRGDQDHLAGTSRPVAVRVRR